MASGCAGVIVRGSVNVVMRLLVAADYCFAQVLGKMPGTPPLLLDSGHLFPNRLASVVSLITNALKGRTIRANGRWKSSGSSTPEHQNQSAWSTLGEVAPIPMRDSWRKSCMLQ